jgi:hypothetical protein
MRKFPLLLAAFFLAALAARAGDLHLEARLIWGTNDEKGAPNSKAVDQTLSSNLHRMFKWKTYYEITNRCAAIAVNKTGDLVMSDHCTLRVKNLGGSRIEVSCIGEGKQVHKGAYTLVPPKWLVLGGSGKDDTAWFVGLRSTDGKSSDAKVISKN